MSSTGPKYAELPAEVLENVFSYVSRHQLTHVVRVCKSFALSGRLLLYRTVELCSDNPHIEKTLNLLRGEQTLGIKVIHATVTTRQPSAGGQQTKPWIEPDFFVYWRRLESLELQGFPFSAVGDIRLFASTLRNSCTQLRKFSFRPGSGSLPSRGFEIEGLEEITWHELGTTLFLLLPHDPQSSPAETRDTPLTPIMRASTTTITHISFFGKVIHRRGVPYDDFLKLRFPSLKTLKLGSLEDSGAGAQGTTNSSITAFILAHPLIESLSLGRSRPTNFFFQFDSQQLKSNSLPYLKSFEGYPENVTTLLRCQVHSLFSITFLSLCCPNEEGECTRVIREMSGAASATNGTLQQLLLVEKLRFETFVILNHFMGSDATSLVRRSWMDQLSQLCPNVVAWCGKLPSMSPDHFVEMFAMYDHLEIIHLPRLSVLLEMSSPIEYFRRISERCINLKFVVARRFNYEKGPDHVFVLQRDEAGILINVHRRVVHAIGNDVLCDQIYTSYTHPQELLG